MVRRPIIVGADAKPLPAHGITVWARDTRQTRFAWSCRCGARWAPLGSGSVLHPSDLPSHDAASEAGRVHINATRTSTKVAEQRQPTGPARPVRTPAPTPDGGELVSCPGCFAPTTATGGLCVSCQTLGARL